MTQSIVLEIPVSTLKGSVVEFDSRAKPENYRLLDANAFVNEDNLRIFELTEFPKERYATISYPWRSVPISTEPPKGTFIVKGTEKGSPLGIGVLETACRAALKFECKFIWIDRLCILQTDDKDKDWQIKVMHSIYKYSDPCLIFLGGPTRLVTLGEETTWIQRAWTLQEAVAPRSAKCLFSWSLGTLPSQGVIPGLIEEVEPNHSAVADLQLILEGSLRGELPHVGEDYEKLQAVRVRVFSSPHAIALRCALEEIEDEDARAAGLWRNSFMRSASRAPDIVFSIMGLFGVTLEPSNYHKEDRYGPMLAFAQELAKMGKRADWMGISLILPALPTMSTMPVLPQTKNQGPPFIDTPGGEKEVAKLIEGAMELAWYMANAPIGTVDEDGYFKFTGKAAAVAKKGTHSNEEGLATIKSNTINGDEVVWEVLGETQEAAEAYAVEIGKLTPYNLACTGCMVIPECHVLMIVEKHGSNRYHRSGLVTVEEAFVAGWENQELNVGGPEDIKAVIMKKE